MKDPIAEVLAWDGWRWAELVTPGPVPPSAGSASHSEFWFQRQEEAAPRGRASPGRSPPRPERRPGVQLTLTFLTTWQP